MVVIPGGKYPVRVQNRLGEVFVCAVRDGRIVGASEGETWVFEDSEGNPLQVEDHPFCLAAGAGSFHQPDLLWVRIAGEDGVSEWISPDHDLRRWWDPEGYRARLREEGVSPVYVGGVAPMPPG